MTAIYTIGFLWGFWVLYVFTMAIYRAKLSKRLGKISTALALPFVLLAVIVDFVANMTVATVLFLDLPREPLVTARLQRYLSTCDVLGWRYILAKLICNNLLDIFDPTGNHCD
jgi:succinate-acetate transporter protein